MSVSENDLETIEAWLDGELPEDRVESLRGRISGDPQLSLALDRLRSDRQLRAGIWRAMEPGDQTIEKLVGNIRRSARHEDVVASRLRLVRNFSAVAASIALVFMAGWLTRSRLQIGQPQSVPQFVQVSNPNFSSNRPAKPTRSEFAAVPGNTVPVGWGGNTRAANSAGTFMGSQPGDPRGAILPRYIIDVHSPMGGVFSYQLDKLSDMVELPQKVEEQELRLQQQVPMPLQSMPRNGDSSQQWMPVSQQGPLPASGR